MAIRDVTTAEFDAAVASGIDTWIANGRRASLVPIFVGKSVGTFFPASTVG